LGFEKKFVNYIIDPLHGQIGLTPLEENVIKTKAFRRLRNIQQLGFASNIYPGATHKRYEHCIGTLHVTWTMFKQFIKNYAVQNQWTNFELMESFSDEMLEFLRLAALLHDLGHGPFSHSFEEVANSMGQKIDHDRITNYLLTYDFPDEAIEDLCPDPDTLTLMKKSEKLKAFREELKVIPTETREPIVGIYEKDYKMLLSKPKGFESIRLFLNNILKGDIGSDRIDYLLRDTYFSGLGHRFNFSDLISNLRGMYDSKSNRLLLAIDSKGRNIVEFIMMTRYYHYRLIAHHPRNVLEETKFKERVKSHLERPAEFTFFSAAMDDDGIERILPPFEKNIELAGAWDMNSIGLDHFRYFFYRLASDSRLRGEYLRRIKNNIVRGVYQHTGLKIHDEDVLLAFVLETPHLPLIQIYREEYQVKKDEDIEKYSVLLHDYSILAQGLARAYLEDSSLLVFARKEDCQNIGKYTRSTHHFYVNEYLFSTLMSSVQTLDKNRYDFLLFALHEITDGGMKVFSGILSLFGKILEMQRKLNVSFYDFDHKYFYDPDRGSFCYPTVLGKEQSLIDDLFMFDAAGLIEIRMHFVNRTYAGKPYHSYSYFFTPTIRTQDITQLPISVIPLKTALRLYSPDFKDKYGLTTERLRSP